MFRSQTPLRFGGFEASNGPSVGAYYDVEQVCKRLLCRVKCVAPVCFLACVVCVLQGELQGVLLVSQLSVENYSPSTGDRRLKEQSEDVFMSACFARKTKVCNSAGARVMLTLNFKH